MGAGRCGNIVQPDKKKKNNNNDDDNNNNNSNVFRADSRL
jgi:hypothetical protein